MPALRVKIPQVPRIEISAVLDIDPSAFEMSVDIFAEEVDLSTLDSDAAAEVQRRDIEVMHEKVSGIFATIVAAGINASCTVLAWGALALINVNCTKCALVSSGTLARKRVESNDLPRSASFKTSVDQTN